MTIEYPFEHPATLFASLGMPADTQIDNDTLLTFGKVLAIIAGADGRLSVWERGWLAAFMAAYGAPPDVISQLDDFHYKGAELEPLLEPLLEGEYAHWVRRSLVQGAIRMSRADEVVAEEYRAIIQAAALIGIDEPTVREIHSLLDIFDSVNTTNATLLSIAQNDSRGDQSLEAADTDTWDIPDNNTPLTPENVLLTQEQLTFARALLFVLAADGAITSKEIDQFVNYIRSWGATDAQIQRLTVYHPTTAEAIIEEANHFHWGLSALTAVALRLAGVDGLEAREEAALLELYQKSGQSPVMYHAVKGLEEVRHLALDRLNAIFAAHM